MYYIDVLLIFITFGMVYVKLMLHFKLIRAMYPNKFKHIEDDFELFFSLRFYTLSPFIQMWLFIPIYIPVKKMLTNEDIRYWHNKLIKNNIYLLLLIVLNIGISLIRIYF